MMCTVCGCGEGEVKIEGHQHTHAHGHHTHDHAHDHLHHHDHNHSHHQHDKQKDAIHFGKGPAHAHAPGLSQSRMIQIEQDILSKNDQYAQQNRKLFEEKGIFTLNLVSSPGSGKTTLLVETIQRLKSNSNLDSNSSIDLAVIEGDQQTTNDAERIRETGVPSIQINTGKGCHLDAHMVGHALEKIQLADYSILFIENVGNLVCPSAFDLGEAHKIAILSVTEGEDKPKKYPDMFAAANIMLLNKIDLLPHLDFDVDLCIDYAKQVNPKIEVIQVSAKSGEGMDQWIEWLSKNRTAQLKVAQEKLQSKLAQLSAALE